MHFTQVRMQGKELGRRECAADKVSGGCNRLRKSIRDQSKVQEGPIGFGLVEITIGPFGTYQTRSPPQQRVVDATHCAGGAHYWIAKDRWRGLFSVTCGTVIVRGLRGRASRAFCRLPRCVGGLSTAAQAWRVGIVRMDRGPGGVVAGREALLCDSCARDGY